MTYSKNNEIALMRSIWNRDNVPVNSKTAHPTPPPLGGNPRAFDSRYAPYSGELAQNEARPVRHLTFVSKRLSAVGNKRILQIFDSAREPRSRAIALVDSTWVFLLLSFYIVIYIQTTFGQGSSYSHLTFSHRQRQ